MAEILHDRGRPEGTTTGRKVNRNALRASLHEKGFIGIETKSHTRDYVLVSLENVPEPRKEVAEVYFRGWEAAFPEPNADGFEWGVRI